MSSCREHLELAEKDLTSKLHSSHQLIKAYESVGTEFESLVQEYTYLLAEIDNKKWALSELQHSSADDIAGT